MTRGADFRAILSRLEPLLGPSEGDVFGQSVQGEVARQPVFDPSGERIRG